MKKGLSVIQINGVKGLFFAGFVICCLAEGFIVFPGWSAMHVWNFAAKYIDEVPAIGIIQGVLLWGILVATYFIFKKEKLVVCMKTPESLSEEELKAVFSDLQKQARNDILIQNMMKARQAELKIKELKEASIPKYDKPTEHKDELEIK